MYEKQERIDKKFTQLEMGRMSHAQFRGSFEECLEEHEEADMDPGNAQTLTRKYIMKLSGDLRHAVSTKMWPLDGPDRVGRKPRTWEEVGDACEMELRDRADCFSHGTAGRRHHALYL